MSLTGHLELRRLLANQIGAPDTTHNSECYFV